MQTAVYYAVQSWENGDTVYVIKLILHAGTILKMSTREFYY